MKFSRMYILKAACSMPRVTHYIEQGDTLTFTTYQSKEWEDFHIEGLNVVAKSLAVLRIDPAFHLINELQGEWQNKMTVQGCVSHHDFHEAIRVMIGEVNKPGLDLSALGRV